MLAPNGLACAFTYADEPVERILLGRLPSAEVLVDEAADQRGKADAAATRLLAKLVVLLWLQRDLCSMHGQLLFASIRCPTKLHQ
jgi:hypothetical protein